MGTYATVSNYSIIDAEWPAVKHRFEQAAGRGRIKPRLTSGSYYTDEHALIVDSAALSISVDIGNPYRVRPEGARSLRWLACNRHAQRAPGVRHQA